MVSSLCLQQWKLLAARRQLLRRSNDNRSCWGDVWPSLRSAAVLCGLERLSSSYCCPKSMDCPPWR